MSVLSSFLFHFNLLKILKRSSNTNKMSVSVSNANITASTAKRRQHDRTSKLEEFEIDKIIAFFDKENLLVIYELKKTHILVKILY
jgi:hypothetical protein